MKKSLYRSLTLILALLAALGSCHAGLGVGDADLVISFSDNLARSILPSISMDADHYEVTITAPSGSTMDFTVEPGDVLAVDDLVYGSYTIDVVARNADGDRIGNGYEEIYLNAGEQKAVSISVSPYAGDGTFALSVFWTAETIQTPVVNAILKDSTGAETSLDMTIDGAIASAETTLEAGYYSLSISLFDDDFLSYGWMEIVRIVADNTTSGELDFTDANINAGTITVEIDADLENPIFPEIGGMADIVGVGEPLLLSASNDENLAGVSYVWYVMGEAVGTGESYVFSSDAKGNYRIDLAAFSTDGSRAGSTGFSTYVSSDIQNYTRISEVQGASHTSPFVGDKVEDVLGVITAVDSRGFWMQSPVDDGDASTSEGIYVYNYYSHSYVPGELVSVDGTVAEFGYEDALKQTQLTYVTVEVISSDFPLPAPVVIGTDGLLPPAEVICNDASGTVYDSVFDPDEDAIDFYESLESMLVEIDDPVAVGGTKYGEIPVLPSGVSRQQGTARGGVYLSEDNANPGVLHIDTDADILGLEGMEADLGDYFNEPVTGIVGYSYGKFIVMPTILPEIVSSGVSREILDFSPEDDELTVATFNIENFPRSDEYMDEGDIQAVVDEIADTIVNALGTPDILALQEMTDDSYSDDDGTVTAAGNYQKLINAIESAGGPLYEYIDIAPADKADGGWPGANIRVGYLYNSATVGFSALGTPTAVAETSVVAGSDGPALSLNPGRFSVASFADSRKSVAAEFSFNGETVFVINNHFNSKSGDTALFGEYQPPVLSSEAERVKQAKAVAALVGDILAMDADANVIVLGDLNDFQFSAPVETLKSAGLVSLTEGNLADGEQYSYIYNGNSQQLDHILATPGLASVSRVDIVHRYAEYYSETRSTDHDPVVAAFDFGGGDPPGDASLFFSEYAEGSSNNKYLEIFNPGTADTLMDGYTLCRYNNGATSASGTYALSGSIPAGGMYIIMNQDADASIVSLGDTTHTGATWYNGDDCLQLVDPSGTVVDQIGILGEDPGSGWTVEGVSVATKEYTLIRKSGVTAGNYGDWAASADAGGDNSEWIIEPQNYWDNLGIHAID